MVKLADVKRDLEKFSNFTKTPMYNYNDIHSENVKNSSHYDYEKIISDVCRIKNISRRDAIKNLIYKQIFRYLPNGEFMVNTQMAQLGGGTNFKNFVAFYNDYSLSTPYHEMAHSFQKTLNVFDNNKKKKLYHDVGLDFDKEPDSLKKDYGLYLNEMHAECFAYFSLLLRSESDFDFANIAFYALNTGATHVLKGFVESKTIYGNSKYNSKYYASLNIMKSLVKQAWKIRKRKEQNKFFDNDGCLNPAKVSDFAENVVLENCYSPKAFEAFKKHNFNFNKTKRGKIPIDHSYLIDLGKSFAFRFAFYMYKYIKSRKKKKDFSKKLSRHNELKNKNISELEKLLASPINPSLPDNLKASQSIKQLHAGVAALDEALGLKRYTEEFIRTILAKHYSKGNFSDKNRRKDVNIIDKMFNNSKKKNFINDILKSMDNVLKQNQNNSEFKKLMSYYKYCFLEQIDILKQIKNCPDKVGYAPDRYYISPLMYSLTNPEKAKLWIKAGADVNQKDGNDFSVLDYALTLEDTPQNQEIIDLLIEKGADVDFAMNHVDDNSGKKLQAAITRVKNKAEQKNNRFALARKRFAKTIDKTFSTEKALGISVEEVKIPKQIKNMELLIAKNIQKIK